MAIGKCFDCKYNIQGDSCMHCAHNQSRKFVQLDKSCPNCGRKVSSPVGGCGACMGRGSYTYPGAYDDCDIDKFDPKYCQVIIDRMLKLNPDIKVTRNGIQYESK